MEYTINKLAGMSGVSTRTLRYYDQIGLLKPERNGNNQYRIYGQAQVDLLQQILFFKELGLELEEIRNIVLAPEFDCRHTLENHLSALHKRRKRIDVLIANVEKTIGQQKGEMAMKDEEKFEGFKQELIDENECRYGAEVRAKYGEETVEASNKKIKNLTILQYDELQKAAEETNEALKQAVRDGNPEGELARKACELHKNWICMSWPEGVYSREAHLGLAEMYCADERFKAYYDAVAEGSAEFLLDALRIYYHNERN